MTRGPAQAGNRASKTGRYLQWWDTGPECTAVTPGVCKVYNYHLFGKLSEMLLCVTIYGASVRLLRTEMPKEQQIPRVANHGKRALEQKASNSIPGLRLAIYEFLCFRKPEGRSRNRTASKSKPPLRPSRITKLGPRTRISNFGLL